MNRPKRAIILYSVLCAWWVLTGVAYHFANLAGAWLYKVLIVLFPLLWMGEEAASAFLFIWIPIAFFAASILIALLPEFTKKQKITAASLPAGAYVLFLGMEVLAHHIA